VSLQKLPQLSLSKSKKWPDYDRTVGLFHFPNMGCGPHPPGPSPTHGEGEPDKIKLQAANLPILSLGRFSQIIGCSIGIPHPPMRWGWIAREVRIPARSKPTSVRVACRRHSSWPGGLDDETNKSTRFIIQYMYIRWGMQPVKKPYAA
jgi:hypothetical protein